MLIYMQLLKITFLLFFIYGCSQLPGINSVPKNQKKTKQVSSYYSIKDIEIRIIKINDLNETEINNFNKSKPKPVEHPLIRTTSFFIFYRPKLFAPEK